jgi:DNA repair exonuclease SbcCD ATPase subunit
MLTLERIKLQNFLSHANTELDLSSTPKLLIDGLSGAGKSAIVDAIIWCFYGKGRSDNRSLIKKGMKTASVKLVAKNGDVRYYFERKVTSTGKHTIEVSTLDEKDVPTPIKITGVKALQDYIESDILQSSYLLFINSAAYPQDNTENFVKQSAEKRKDLILEIIKASDYDAYYDRSRAFLRDKEMEFGVLTAEIKADIAYVEENKLLVGGVKEAEENLKDVEKYLAMISSTIKTLEDANKENEATRSRINEISIKIQVVEKAIELMSEANKILKNKINTLEGVDMNAINLKIIELDQLRRLINDYENWKKEYEKITQDCPKDYVIKEVETEINEINKKIVGLQNLPSLTCPQCGADCPHVKNDREAQIADYTELLVKKMKKEDELKEKVKSIGVAVEKLGEACCDPAAYEQAVKDEKALRQIELQMSAYEKDANDLGDYRTQVVANDIRLDELYGEKEELGVEKTELLLKFKPDIAEQIENTRRIETEQLRLQNNLESRLEFARKVEANYNKSVARIAEIQKQLYRINEDVEAVSAVKEAFGSKGIKSIVVDYVLPQLEDRINEVLSKMSDFTIRLETQKDNAKGDGFIEGLFVTVTNGQGETFDLANYSGGERNKINAAVSEGLASLQKIGFRILDESITGLDNSTIENFLEVLKGIETRFEQLICISHLQPVKDAFSKHVLVQKVNGTSTIKTYD